MFFTFFRKIIEMFLSKVLEKLLGQQVSKTTSEILFNLSLFNSIWWRYLVTQLISLTFCYYWMVLFILYQQEMEVKDLSIQTNEELSHALEKRTLNWEELMRSDTFASIYSENNINNIRMTGFRPAMALIEDIVSREIPLKVLLRGLLDIGNRKAISIIEKDMMSKGFYVEDSGGRPPPPPYICRQPEEHDMASSSYAPLIQRGEQSETLAYPVQESGTNNDSRPCVPRRPGYMEIVLSFFPCLSLPFVP